VHLPSIAVTEASRASELPALCTLREDAEFNARLRGLVVRLNEIEQRSGISDKLAASTAEAVSSSCRLIA
jgi:hypothetical protein